MMAVLGKLLKMFTVFLRLVAANDRETNDFQFVDFVITCAFHLKENRIREISRDKTICLQ